MSDQGERRTQKDKLNQDSGKTLSLSPDSAAASSSSALATAASLDCVNFTSAAHATLVRIIREEVDREVKRLYDHGEGRMQRRPLTRHDSRLRSASLSYVRPSFAASSAHASSSQDPRVSSSSRVSYLRPSSASSARATTSSGNFPSSSAPISCHRPSPASPRPTASSSAPHSFLRPSSTTPSSPLPPSKREEARVLIEKPASWIWRASCPVTIAAGEMPPPSIVPNSVHLLYCKPFPRSQNKPSSSSSSSEKEEEEELLAERFNDGLVITHQCHSCGTRYQIEVSQEKKDDFFPEYFE
ncbi:hypothetical protein Nepgr_031159 [Nepenthes gracilis]|uniref:Uncharacterized protein n=1 Tax=Nepenthes gracilis TaxID=150966 RepID=A0AAD3THY2_NEPGR|nr:hypothetical protein Nepgr_031159 [Nepenthes gracilis]